MATNMQSAPFPTDLEEMVANLTYRALWTFSLTNLDRGQGSEGLTLVILITTEDAYNRDRQRSVVHYMPVPPAAYDRRSWRRWLLDQCIAVDRHEACEMFEIEGEGKPFAPNHGPGRDPYTIFDYAEDTDRRTSFRGEIKEIPVDRHGPLEGDERSLAEKMKL